MIEGLLALLCCQLAGELAARTLHLRLPGPVLGMLLLLALLGARSRWSGRGGGPDGELEDPPVMRAGDRVLEVLPLLFVPAGVGVMTMFPVLRDHWLPLGAGLVMSWAAALLGTAGAASLVRRRDRVAPSEAAVVVAAADELEGADPDHGGTR